MFKYSFIQQDLNIINQYFHYHNPFEFDTDMQGFCMTSTYWINLIISEINIIIGLDLVY